MQKLSFNLRMFSVDKKKYLPCALFSFLRNGIGIVSEFLWDDFGMILGLFWVFIRQNRACFSMLASAKLQRGGADSKFFAILWCFKM